jgi:hypothetical protein
MQLIENYVKKIDDAIASKGKKVDTSKSLFSPLKKENKKSEDKDFLLIVNVVKGIREAREKMLNGR